MVWYEPLQPTQRSLSRSATVAPGACQAAMAVRETGDREYGASAETSSRPTASTAPMSGKVAAEASRWSVGVDARSARDRHFHRGREGEDVDNDQHLHGPRARGNMIGIVASGERWG